MKQWEAKIGNSARSCIWGKSSRVLLLQSHLPQEGQFRITLSLLLPHTGQERQESRDTIQLFCTFNSVGNKHCVAKTPTTAQPFHYTSY